MKNNPDWMIYTDISLYVFFELFILIIALCKSKFYLFLCNIEHGGTVLRYCAS